jgi:hypothetical protein
MVERLLDHGELEAHLQLASGKDRLHVRSIAWTGDEVGWRLRPEGYVPLRQIARLHPGAKLVLLSPIAVEGDAARDTDIAAFSAVIADLAKARGAHRGVTQSRRRRSRSGARVRPPYRIDRALRCGYGTTVTCTR